MLDASASIKIRITTLFNKSQYPDMLNAWLLQTEAKEVSTGLTAIE